MPSGALNFLGSMPIQITFFFGGALCRRKNLLAYFSGEKRAFWGSQYYLVWLSLIWVVLAVTHFIIAAITTGVGEAVKLDNTLVCPDFPFITVSEQYAVWKAQSKRHGYKAAAIDD